MIGPQEAAALYNVANISVMRLAGLGLIAFGCLVATLTSLTAYSNARVAKWPTVKAVVTEVTQSTRIEHDLQKKRDVRITVQRVRFSYVVSGRPYESVREYDQDDPAVFGRGMMYVVHYDPADPQNIAVFVSPASTVALVGAIFGSVFVIVGVLFYRRSRVLDSQLVR